MDQEGATVEIRSVHEVHVSAKRKVIELPVPGSQSNVFQDMGRDPRWVRVEGRLIGKAALDTLKMIKSKFNSGELLPFSSDIWSVEDVTTVIFEGLSVRVHDGIPLEVRYTMLLREAKPPPEESTEGEGAPSQKEEAEREIEEKTKEVMGKEKKEEEGREGKKEGGEERKGKGKGGTGEGKRGPEKGAAEGARAGGEEGGSKPVKEGEGGAGPSKEGESRESAAEGSKEEEGGLKDEEGASEEDGRGKGKAADKPGPIKGEEKHGMEKGNVAASGEDGGIKEGAPAGSPRWPKEGMGKPPEDGRHLAGV